MIQRIRTGLGRAFNVVPQRAVEQTGVTIVGILFGLVIGRLAQDGAAQIVAIWRGVPFVETAPGAPAPAPISKGAAFAQRDVALLHVLVGLTLTVTSAIGYYTSRNLPRLRIRFFNKAFFQFVLDVSMVFTYFLVLEFVEATKTDQSARPEAVLVFVSFVLYVGWDRISLWTRRNALDSLALGRRPDTEAAFGRRREVTVWCTLIALALMLAALTGVGDRSDTSVAVFDWLLIALLVLYRIAKSMVDDKIEVRGAARRASDPIEEYAGRIHRTDLQQVLPAAVEANLGLIDEIADAGRPGWVVPAGDPATLAVVQRLIAEGALVPQLVGTGETRTLRVSLAGAGRAAAKLTNVT